MMENIKIYSFDVFDTVLTRTVVDPKDIFILIFRKDLGGIQGQKEHKKGGYRDRRHICTA
jgi:UPF0288 family protein (methanogenesis marker protein 3)